MTYIQNDITGKKTTTGCEAQGILRRLGWFKTVFLVCFWNTINHRIQNSSKSIQNESVSVRRWEICMVHLKNISMKREIIWTLWTMTIDLTKTTEYEKDSKKQP